MNKRSKALPPEKGPTPQGMKNGDEIKVGKGLKFRSSGDISYEKRVQPKTDVKITYNTKKKKVKNLKLRTNILGGDLVVGKDKYGTTANYSKNLLKGNLNISGYKTPKDKGIGFQFVKKFQIGALSDLGCPYRENGVQGSDIKGVKPIQVKGKKFIGVK
jgi:hypothetical protein|tara:strand:+ start:716 stop:1192 length:477 start_codon:yes stop_codon:yes gene_type:complete